MCWKWSPPKHSTLWHTFDSDVWPGWHSFVVDDWAHPTLGHRSMSQFNAFAVTLDFQSNDKLLDFSFEQNFFKNKIKNFHESELFCFCQMFVFWFVWPKNKSSVSKPILLSHIVLYNNTCNWWKSGLKPRFLIPDATALTMYKALRVRKSGYLSRFFKWAQFLISLKNVVLV